MAKWPQNSSSRSWEKCITDGPAGRQTDGWGSRTNFIENHLQRWRSDHVFWKFENKILLNYLAWLNQKWAKNRNFWIYWKKLVISFYLICSLMQIYIIFCVPAQNPYLGKFLFLRLQDFKKFLTSKTNQWNSLIFRMLIQIHIN